MPFRLFQAFKKELLSSANVSTRSFPVPAPCPSVMSFVQIYEGVKSLPLRKLSLDVLIFRHQSTASFFDMKSKEWVESFIPNCIEIVAFDHSSPELEAPHFFLSPKVFYDQLKETNVSDTNGIASRNAHRDLLASDLIIKFVLNRVKVSSEDSTSFEITLSALADDELDFNFIAIKRPGNISSIHDQLKLRKRRSIAEYENMKKFADALFTNKITYSQIDLDCEKATEMSDAATIGLDFSNKMLDWLLKKKERSLILKGFSLSRQRWISAIQRVILRLRVYKTKILLQKYDIDYVGCNPDLGFGLTPVELFHAYCTVKVECNGNFVLDRIPSIKPRKIFFPPPNKDNMLPLLQSSSGKHCILHTHTTPHSPVDKRHSLRNQSPLETSPFSPSFCGKSTSSKRHSLHSPTPSSPSSPHNASPEGMLTKNLSSRDMKPHTPERTLRKRSPCEREGRLKSTIKKEALLPSIILQSTSQLDIAGQDLLDSFASDKIQLPCLSLLMM